MPTCIDAWIIYVKSGHYVLPSQHNNVLATYSCQHVKYLFWHATHLYFCQQLHQTKKNWDVNK